MTVVDASVVIKWFVEERDADLAHAVLGSRSRLMAPAHLVAEVARGLLRKRRLGDISTEDARQALSELPSIVRLSEMAPLAIPAFDIADSCSITVYDALYVALAAETESILVTADRRLCDSVRPTRWVALVRHLADATPVQKRSP